MYTKAQSWIIGLLVVIGASGVATLAGMRDDLQKATVNNAVFRESMSNVKIEMSGMRELTQAVAEMRGEMRQINSNQRSIIYRLGKIEGSGASTLDIPPAAEANAPLGTHTP